MTTTPAAWRVAAAPRAPLRIGHALNIRKGLVAGRGKGTAASRAAVGPSSGDGYTAAVIGSVSLAAAEDKLTQLDARARRATTINLGIPAFSEITGRTASLSTRHPRASHTNIANALRHNARKSKLAITFVLTR
jgi:hypothetical protein